ncbi:MAG: ABC transporter ATP-binding protein [Pseudomonadota bacterium]|nr:ABC transporter ATP-binding protein [Pseudomonadota bacterium]
MSDLLTVEKIMSSYDDSQVLFGISIRIGVGEMVTLLGRNGMGKTSTVRSIMGLLRPHSGDIYFKGKPLTGYPSYKVAQEGIGLVPEGRQVFPNLSVIENLIATEANRQSKEDPWNVEKVFDLFPSLKDRKNHMGNQLSGGEQQMLAISRALMTNPELLILDEATEGLAPLIRAEIWEVLETLKSQKQSILVIDKNIDALSRIADRHYIIEKGLVAWSGNSQELVENKELQERYLGV